MNHDSEDGFTLVELLVATVITGIIVGVLGSAFIVSFRATEEAGDRLAVAQDLQLLTASFGSDVQSADIVRRTATTPACGSDTPVISMQWDDLGTVVRVSYAVDSGGSAPRLVRYECRGATTAQRVAAHAIGTPVAAPECNGTPCAASGDLSPREVTLRVVDGAGTTHAISATRRVS